MIHWLMFLNAQGKVRLDRWFSPYTLKERSRIKDEVMNNVLSRNKRNCNFVEWKQFTLIYRKYASLYIIFCCDNKDNQLIMLEMIHMLIQSFDNYFGNVCELDLIFNFDKAYQILDEMIIAGELQEPSRMYVVKFAKRTTVDIDEDQKDSDVDKNIMKAMKQTFGS